MKRLGLILAVIFIQAGEVAEACGRCRKGHARPQRAACPPRMASYPAMGYPTSTVASPQMTYAAPVAPASPMASPTSMASAPVTATGAVEPLYNYAAADQSRPAYYYSYDNSGKLVVSQWIDYVFRGGKADGMPRPPLPIIGALRNRD